MISDPKPLACLVPLHQSRRIAPSPGRRAVLWKRRETSAEPLEIALGDEIAVEWFECGRAAAYEPGVYLENPIVMSNQHENRTECIKKKKQKKKKGVTYIQRKTFPAYHVLSVAWSL